MSLLYECINTVIAVLISISSGMPNHSASIQLCVQKLRILIEDSDQNLKYLGLLAMSKILKTHPKSVQAHKDLILACLDDKDESIRLRALDLLYGMVSKKNLMEIVKRLLGHMERAEGSAYRDELLYKVIEICSQASYLYVTNFEWYLTVLVELIQLEAGSKHGHLIAEQLLDVAIRVPVVRQFAVNEMTNLLDTFPISSQSNSMYEVLYAAAWVVGEFSNELEDTENTLNILLRPRQVPGQIQAVFVQNVVKLLTRIVTTCLENNDVAGITKVCDHVLNKLENLNSSMEIEVQDRANSACLLITMLRSQFHPTTDDLAIEIAVEGPSINIPSLAIEIVQEMALLFDGELIPVAPKAQRKVPLPDGLNLDEWINIQPDDNESGNSSQDEEKVELFVQSEEYSKRQHFEDLTPEQLEQNRRTRLIEQSNNPHYLKSSPSKTTRINTFNMEYDNLDDIPITELSLEIPQLKVGCPKRSDMYLQDNNKLKGKKHKNKKTKKSKKSKNKASYSSTESDEELKPVHIINNTLAMPEGITLSDSEDKDGQYDPNDPHRALDIDLYVPDLNLKNNASNCSVLHDMVDNMPRNDNVNLTKNPKPRKEKKKKTKMVESDSHSKPKKNKENRTIANLLGVSSEDLILPPLSSTESQLHNDMKKKKKSKSSNKEDCTGYKTKNSKEKRHQKNKKDRKHKTIKEYEDSPEISLVTEKVFMD